MIAYGNTNLREVGKLMEKELKASNGNFTLIGEFNRGTRNPFQLNVESQSGTGYVYSRLEMPIDCGAECGTIYVHLQDGYNPRSSDNKIYCHTKDGDGKTDWKTPFNVAWEDRLNEDIIKEVSDFDLITVGIEKDVKGNIVYKKFLSAYDVIDYLNENLEDGSVLRVSGKIEFGYYDNHTTRQLIPHSIILSNVVNKQDFNKANDFKATFNQEVLLSKDSIGEFDKEMNELEINGYVASYIYKYDGKKVKKINALPYKFYFNFSDVNEKQRELIIKKVIKVKKGVSKITFSGEFHEGGTVVKATMDDVSDELKQLVQLGLYTEDEVIGMVSTSDRQRKMVLKNLYVRKSKNDDGTVSAALQVFPEEYDEDVLDIDLTGEEEEEHKDDVNDADDLNDTDLEEMLSNLNF